MNKKAFVFIILAGLLWGTSGLFVHFLSPFGFRPMHMICMRGVVAAVCMCIYALICDKKLFVLTKKEVLFALVSGVSMFGCGAAYYAAIKASSVSTAVVLMYTAPVIVMAFSVAFMGEKLTKLKIVSVVCMLIGCALVSGIIGGMRFGVLGILLGLLSGVMYSAYNIFTKLQMKQLFHPISCTMYCFIVMAILALLCSDPIEMCKISAKDLATTLPLMIGIGVCTSVLPYFLYTLSLKELPVGVASALSIVEPMAATVYSVVFLKEQLTPASVIGIVLILGSVFLLSKSKQ